MIPALILENQGSSVTAIKHGSTLFRDEPKKAPFQVPFQLGIPPGTHWREANAVLSGHRATCKPGINLERLAC
ncbi:hypothetical protein FYA67_05210 [Bordetella holmesii]|nr:hypothetical protein FYB59_05210 [Bordetella holmesii]QGB14381.1 hypothetical protein FYB57_05210 [Bordetella holmesii]QGB63625.1 hypothetical protein FYB43_05210 [Bordetella holmesii]QGC42174.1 hypothetical protein FYB19_05210 [Bordetella holmesii]QGC62083.1 hypothetical protein FYB13_05210 [Bordetella holmesii]